MSKRSYAPSSSDDELTPRGDPRPKRGQHGREDRESWMSFVGSLANRDAAAQLSMVRNGPAVDSSVYSDADDDKKPSHEAANQSAASSVTGKRERESAYYNGSDALEDEDDEDDEDNDRMDAAGSYQSETRGSGQNSKGDRPLGKTFAGAKRSGVNSEERERRREELRRARAERKRCREKERRSNVNREYIELTALLTKIDSSGFSAGDDKLSDSGAPASRLDLISRTIQVLDRLYEENVQLKKKLLSAGVKVPDENAVRESSSTPQGGTAGKRGDEVGTLFVPVMVPFDYPVNQSMLNRDNSIPMSRVPPDSIFPLGSGVGPRVLMGGNNSYNARLVAQSYPGGRGMLPGGQNKPYVSSHGEQGFFPPTRWTNQGPENPRMADIETIMAMNRSMGPGVQRPASIRDVEAMLALNRSLSAPTPASLQQAEARLALRRPAASKSMRDKQESEYSKPRFDKEGKK